MTWTRASITSASLKKWSHVFGQKPERPSRDRATDLNKDRGETTWADQATCRPYVRVAATRFFTPIDELWVVYVKRNSPAALIKYSKQQNPKLASHARESKTCPSSSLPTHRSILQHYPPPQGLHTCPGSLIQIDFYLEGLPMEKSCRLTRKEQIKRSRCTSPLLGKFL